MTLADLPSIEAVDAECERRRAAFIASRGDKAALAALLDAVAEYRRRIEAGASHPGPGVAGR